jgi:hypothetical protein
MKLDWSKRPTISQVIKMLQETDSAVQSHPMLIDDNQVLPVDLPTTSVPFYVCELVVVLFPSHYFTPMNP